MARIACPILFLLLLAAGAAQAAPVVEPVRYEIDGTAFESLLVYDDRVTSPRLGAVMIPNWLGINDTAIARARELAGDRYVILLADMYGTAVRPKDFDEAGQASGAVLGDRALTRTRVQRALQALREAGAAHIGDGPVAAFGFCFGGTVALELARSGADVAAAISFHGNPGPVVAAERGAVKGSVLVLHGAADGYVPAEQIRAFEAEMDAAGADWTLVSFSGAKHCFAEAEANNTPPGCLYDARASRRAYDLMHDFLAPLRP